MKRSMAVQLIIMALSILSVVLFLNEVPLFYILLCLLLEAAILMYNVYEASKTNRMMEFLIRDNKQKMQKQVSWDVEEEEKLKIVRRRVEISALQSQINPHFLYNTLDSIRSKALLDGQTEIASMTEILSKFFRYCISNDDGLVKIREEINHIKSYYYIQKYRFEERVHMDFSVEEEGIYDLYIPKMTLQPLVENAMIHGLEKVALNGRILLEIICTEKKVVITISDNGIGMSAEQLERLNLRMKGELIDAGVRGKRNNGIALTNVNSRIKITFGKAYGIHYRSMEGGGTDAVITIPRIDEFKRVRYEKLLDDNM